MVDLNARAADRIVRAVRNFDAEVERMTQNMMAGNIGQTLFKQQYGAAQLRLLLDVSEITI